MKLTRHISPSELLQTAQAREALSTMPVYCECGVWIGEYYQFKAGDNLSCESCSLIYKPFEIL